MHYSLVVGASDNKKRLNLASWSPGDLHSLRPAHHSNANMARPAEANMSLLLSPQVLRGLHGAVSVLPWQQKQASGCSWGKARGGWRADGLGDPRRSRELVPRLASSSDSETPSPSVSLLWPRQTQQMGSQQGPASQHGTGSAGVGQLPRLLLSCNTGAQNHGILSREAQRNPTI